LLEDMEVALLEVEQLEDRTETINRIFRAAHTIKGSGGLFGLEGVVEFTHVVENVLDRVRDGAVPISRELIGVMLNCCDHIGLLIGEVEAGRLEPDPDIVARGEPLKQQLLLFMPKPQSATQAAGNAGWGLFDDALRPAGQDSGWGLFDDTAPAERGADAGWGLFDDEPPVDDAWHISLRFGPEVLRKGMDPLSFLHHLRTVGEIAGIVTLVETVPTVEQIDPERCYLGFEIAFRSNADKAAIENVFAFVRDDCAIRLVPPSAKIEEYIRLIEELPEENTKLGEMLVRCGSVTAHELGAALAAQAAAAAHPPIGEMLVEQGAVQQPVVEAAL